MEEKKHEKKKINYLIILVGLLLIFTVFQSFQISALKEEVGTSTNDGSSQIVTTTQQNNAPTNPAPVTMVGGC